MKRGQVVTWGPRADGTEGEVDILDLSLVGFIAFMTDRMILARMVTARQSNKLPGNPIPYSHRDAPPPDDIPMSTSPALHPYVLPHVEEIAREHFKKLEVQRDADRRKRDASTDSNRADGDRNEDGGQDKAVGGGDGVQEALGSSDHMLSEGQAEQKE